MIRTRNRSTLCWVLLALNLTFIWGNSLMRSDISSAISGWLGSIVELLFKVPVGSGGSGHGLLRKIAHFSEFACLGILLTWRCGMDGNRGKNLIAGALFGVLSVACVDETIQIFVPGRSSSLIDVWIDTMGGSMGMMCLLAGHHIRKNR